MHALEFSLPPDDLPALLRHAAVKRRGRPAHVELVWYDTASGALAAEGLSLCESRGAWRLERARPGVEEAWPPGTPPPLVAEGTDPGHFGTWPSPLMPIAGFRGQQRRAALAGEEGASVLILDGVLRGVAQERPVCRVVLHGSAPVLEELSHRMAENVKLGVPRWSLAAEAMAVARGTPPVARRSGGPTVPPEMGVADAVAFVIGHLTDVILEGIPGVIAADGPGAVHATRVAARRLRSALSVFRRAAGGPAFEAIGPQLAQLATNLGAARDWDVLLEGTGPAVAAALPGDRRVDGMIATAGKRRDAAYAALRVEFASTAFRQLSIALVQLAALRPWQDDADDERAATLAQPAAAYASMLLRKRHKRMLETGADIDHLPTEDLHTLRKQGKKLRYAAEFFLMFGDQREARRFVRRLSQLQEALGRLNDAVTAATLMDRLGVGADRQFAAGVVMGFTAAHNAGVREAIADAWHKFRKTRPFWA